MREGLSRCVGRVPRARGWLLTVGSPHRHTCCNGMDGADARYVRRSLPRLRARAARRSLLYADLLTLPRAPHRIEVAETSLEVLCALVEWSLRLRWVLRSPVAAAARSRVRRRRPQPGRRVART